MGGFWFGLVGVRGIFLEDNILGVGEEGLWVMFGRFY